MKHICKTLMMVSMLTASCSSQYVVNGISTVESLEGRTLYLKVYQNDDMQTIDSSSVVHGKFRFSGVLDSTVMANVFLGETSVMPVVIEEGLVSLKIDENIQSATGTPLNDSLSSFIRRKTQLESQLAELPRKESQMIMAGMDLDEINERLNEEAQGLSLQNDRLVTHFILANSNNVLGPGIFMILTSNYRFPILNPQIEEITTHASPYFMNHPYVREYLKAAEANMEKIREQHLKE